MNRIRSAIHDERGSSTDRMAIVEPKMQGAVIAAAFVT